MGSDYTLEELKYWNEKIEAIVEKTGLNPYFQEFEMCDYEDMLGYEAYLGMPARYPHWSFGKSYERLKTFYSYNLSGLPYEMVINSDPCLAYLMKDNTLLLQVLTMAHVYGHNDFFKNNRLFKMGTRAEYTIEMFKSHARRVREYISDPSIGYEKVERILDAAHALRLQIYRWVGEKRLDEQEKKERLIEQSNYQGGNHVWEKRVRTEIPDLNKIPLEPEEDLLLFLSKYAKLQEWEKDLILIVRDESQYFLPQIETKIMNEGWACYWHYYILNKLNLPQGLYLEFLKRHNQVVRPFEGGINPYHMGFKIFMDLAKRFADQPEFIFSVREEERDSTFIRKYLSRELCEELKLFEYYKTGRDYLITEVSDEQGWKKIRDNLANNVGVNSIPNIRVMEVKSADNTLMLEHEWDGKELQLQYAQETIKYIAELWKSRVSLRTTVRASTYVLESDSQ